MYEKYEILWAKYNKRFSNPYIGTHKKIAGTHRNEEYPDWEKHLLTVWGTWYCKDSFKVISIISVDIFAEIDNSL